MGKQSHRRKASILSKFFAKPTDEFESHPFNRSTRKRHPQRSGKVNPPKLAAANAGNMQRKVKARN